MYGNTLLEGDRLCGEVPSPPAWGRARARSGCSCPYVAQASQLALKTSCLARARSYQTDPVGQKGLCAEMR